jgi:hypothetical protein
MCAIFQNVKNVQFPVDLQICILKYSQLNYKYEESKLLKIYVTQNNSMV